MEGSLETLFAGVASRANPAGMLTIPDEVRCLDTNDLEKLESAFRAWVAKGRGAGVTLARRRILALFLLLRHTGARLGEASGLEGRSLVLENGLVRLGTPPRDVLVAETVLAEIVGLVATGGGRESPVLPEYPFAVDPGHVRRKFYACAEAAGLGREMGSPSVLRRSRAVELLRGGVPLPAVQRLLGHGNAELTAAYVAVPDDAMRRMVGDALDREQRRSSARNAFFGRGEDVRIGDVQASVRLQTPTGLEVLAIITNDSLEALGLARGAYALAEVKAPWVVLQRGEHPRSSAGNVYPGEVVRVRKGAVSAEVIVRLDAGTEVCAVLAADTLATLELCDGAHVWVVINALSVILNAV